MLEVRCYNWFIFLLQVYFLWICPTHRQFEWFIDVLRDVERKDVTNVLEMHIFITQFFHKFDLRTTMLVSLFGRRYSVLSVLQMGGVHSFVLGCMLYYSKKTYAGLWYEIDPIRKFEYFCKILWNQSIIFYCIWALQMVWPKLCLFFSIFARTTSSDWANGACSLDWKPSITSAGLIWRPSWSLCKRRITT